MPEPEFYIIKDVSIHNSIPSLKFAASNRNLKRIDTPIDTYDRYKISIILTDGMSVLYGGHIHRAVRGDICFFRPDEPHRARIHREGIHSYTDIFIPQDFFKAFKDDLSEWEYIFSDTQPNRINFISPPTEARMELLSLSEQCNLLAAKDIPGNNILIFTKLIRMMELIASLYISQKEHPCREDTPAAVSTALQYIHENYQTISGLPEIAKKCSCSVTYLTKTFRAYTGETVNGFLTECRLSRAKALLMQGCSVTQSCYDSGFGDCSHFIRIFKKSEGVTPLAYRKKHLTQ